MHRLIVVDDDTMLLPALRRAMSRYFEVQAFADARDALAFLAGGGAVDAVLSDVTMHPMDGKAFRGALLASRPDLEGRVFMMSGGAVTAELQEFLRDTEHFEKPFRMQDAAESILRAIGA